MKYGLNFGHKEIPDDRKGFKQRIRVAFTDGWYWLTLEGLASSEHDRNEMVIQADNGHRKIHSVLNHKSGWYGIYLA